MRGELSLPAVVMLAIAACNGEDADATAASNAGSESAGSSASGDTPCDAQTGEVSDACASWLQQQCAPLDPAQCQAFAPVGGNGSELGCAVAHALDAADGCAEAQTACVAAMHTGEGPQGALWFEGDAVYRVDCDQTALPCPAIVVFGWSACGIEAGAPGVCGCTD